MTALFHKVWIHRASLSPSPFIEVAAQSQESER